MKLPERPTFQLPARRVLFAALAVAALLAGALLGTSSQRAEAHSGADQLHLIFDHSSCLPFTATLGIVSARCLPWSTAAYADYVEVSGYNQHGTWVTWKYGRAGDGRYMTDAIITRGWWWQTERPFYLKAHFVSRFDHPAHWSSGWYSYNDRWSIRNTVTLFIGHR